MSDNSIDRKTLLAAVKVARPALATAAYVPALSHLAFDDGQVVAYNDIAAIWAALDLGFTGCLPGEQLIKALETFSSETVSLETLENGNTVVKSGRSKMTMPTLKLADYPMPKMRTGKGATITLSPEIIRGVTLCLMNVGNDPTHPAQMGVTLDRDEDGMAVLYSTDNTTISRFQTETKVDDPDACPVIMPTFFCQQLISLWDTYADAGGQLLVAADSLMAQFGRKKATLFSRILPDLEALDFAKQFERVVTVAKARKLAANIPDAWDACFQRAALVLADEADKITEVTANGERLKLYSKSQRGEVDDVINTELADMVQDKILVDPGLILRAGKYVTKAAFTPKATVLTNDTGTFIHLIAHMAA